jgi:cytochrome c6
VKLRLILAAVLLAVLAGCGGDDGGGEAPSSGGGDPQQLYVENCGNCHELAAAKTSGKVGPSLDQLRPSPDLVRTQVENGGGGMPAFKSSLSPEEIQAISNYVADNAGKTL